MENSAIEPYTHSLEMNDKSQMNTKDLNKQANEAFTSRINIFPTTIVDFEDHPKMDKNFVKENVLGTSFFTNYTSAETKINVKEARSIFKNTQIYLFQNVEKSLILQGVCGLLIPFIATLYSLTVVAWPQHNVITHPEYWYEAMGPVIVGNYLVTVTAGLLDCRMIMKVDFILSKKAFLKMFFVNVLGFAIPYISIHILWVHMLDFNHPMPFIGQLCWLIGFISRGIQFWFLFPTTLRVDDKIFRKRILAYLSFYPTSVIMALGYNQMTSLFVHVPLHFQWLIGIFIPILKEFNTWWNTKIAFKASGNHDVDSRIVMIIYVLSVHSLSLTLLLPNVSSLTAFLLIVFESIPSLWSYIKIIKRHRQKCNTECSGQLDEILKCLVVDEYFELLIPFVYCASFVLAYFGPNSEVLGNVRNDYWQYEKVENLPEKLANVTTFAVIITARGLVFCSGLWIVCKINMLRIYCYVVFHYGIFILLYITATLNAVSRFVF